MRRLQMIGVGIVSVVGLIFILHAQEATLLVQEIQPIGKAQPDSIVQLAAEVQGLELMSRESLPENGTFWVVTPENGVTAPWPCAPRDASLPIYAIADGQFIVDATRGKVSLNILQDAGGSLDSALEALADSVGNLISWIQGVELTRQMAVAFGMEEELAAPSGFAPMMMVFEPGSLFLEITGITNTGSGLTADLVIHPPGNVTNGVYDLFATTNLAPSAWAWVLRCDPGQTNLTLTGRPDPIEFYILGLTTDTDTDGLTDAYENLVSHTLPNNADENGNGIPDGWEWQYFGNLNQTPLGDADADGLPDFLDADPYTHDTTEPTFAITAPDEEAVY